MKTLRFTQVISFLLVASLCASSEKQADAFYERGLAAEKRGNLIAADHLYTLATRALPGHTEAQAKLEEFQIREEPLTKLMAQTALVHAVRIYFWFATDANSIKYRDQRLNAFLADVSSQSGIPLVIEHFDCQLRLDVTNTSLTGLLDEIEKQTGLVRRYERHAVILSPGQVPLSELNPRGLSRNNMYNKLRTSEGLVRQIEGGTDGRSSFKISLENSPLYLSCRPQHIQAVFAGAIPADTIKPGSKVKFIGRIQNNRGTPWVDLVSADQLEILGTPPQAESEPVASVPPIPPAASSPLNIEKIELVDPFAAPVWKSKDGKSVEGEFVGLDGEAVVIKRAGKEFTIPFSRLDAVSVTQAKRLNEPETEPEVSPD